MRAFFDTSVLVAAAVRDHQHQQRSRAALASIAAPERFCGAHSLAECYATWTRQPRPERLSALDAAAMVRGSVEIVIPVALDPAEYLAAIEDAAALRVVGGTVYDFLLARCALKVRAEVFYTWNLHHFQLLGPEIAAIAAQPE